MESLFLIPGLGAPTGLEWLQLDHVLNVRGCICGRCVGKGAEVLWVIWAFISYIGFRNKHSSSVFYWFGHISGFDPKKTRTQNLGIKWIYRYVYIQTLTYIFIFTLHTYDYDNNLQYTHIALLFHDLGLFLGFFLGEHHGHFYGFDRGNATFHYTCVGLTEVFGSWDEQNPGWSFYITHSIHGTGRFTYMNGWFLWFSCR